MPFERIERSPTPGLVLHRLLRHLGFHPDMLDRVRDAIISRHTRVPGSPPGLGGLRRCENSSSAEG